MAVLRVDRGLAANSVASVENRLSASSAEGALAFSLSIPPCK